MTEQEWLAATIPWDMLQVVRRSLPSNRKIRLISCAMCRLLWDYLPAASKAIVLESEYLADGITSVTSDELCRRANKAVPPLNPDFTSGTEREAAVAVCYAVLPEELFVAASAVSKIIPKDQTRPFLIRDIIGNPFRPVALDSSWLTATVLSLAEGIYAERAFDRLPILADALQDAGCDNEDILNHCRQPGDHVRGCWAVDLLLGKV